MSKIETKNAKIESTMLGVEDHGIMSFMLMLDYGGGSIQGAGGYALDTPLKDNNGKFIKRVGGAPGMTLIMRILEVVGVDKWEDLKGEHIRVKAEFTSIHAIGNLLKDDWLDFKEFFKDQE